MASSRKRAKPSKPLTSVAVKKWIEEQEATANLWLLVSEPDVFGNQQIRIPARRDFISHFSELIRSLDADDSECPVIGFYAETVVEFCRACMPHLNGLPRVDEIPDLCKLIKLAHFLAAPQLTNHFMNELQERDIWETNELIAFFDVMRHVGKTIFWKKDLKDYTDDFVFDYSIGTRISEPDKRLLKKQFPKEVHQMFTLHLEQMKDECRSEWTTAEYEDRVRHFEQLAEWLLEMARPASTS